MSVRAAVDVGTNTVRLLVVDQHGAPIDRALRITRLGTGIDATGRFDPDALERTLDAVTEFSQRWRAHGAQRVRIGATSAVRDAADRDRFFAGVRERTGGCEAEVLTGNDEARLTFLGVTSGLDLTGTVAIVDVGGGSTELAVGHAGAEAPARSISLQVGSVRLTERLLHDDPPGRAELDRASAEIEDRLDEADAALRETPLGAADQMIGVAGTATTLAMLVLGHEEWTDGIVHGQRVATEDLARQVAELAAKPVRVRAAMSAIQPGREDVIVAGGMILVAALRRGGFDELVVSEADILDGLAQTA